MVDQFKSFVESMYLEDKEESKRRRFANLFNISNIDPLDDYYDGRQWKIFRCPHDEERRVDCFNQCLLDAYRAKTSEVNCNKKQILIKLLRRGRGRGYIKKEESIFRYSIISDIQKATYNPLSLKHIAAAKSIPMLENYNSNILIGIYKATKNQDLYLRVGTVAERRNYKFANIVKHIIYKQMYEPLTCLQYFENLKLNPTSFCVDCGLIKKAESYRCFCIPCYVLQGTLQFTPAVERPFHTTYHIDRFHFNQCSK